MSTIATRFRGSSPLPDLKKLTLMFDTFILQYLNKLGKGKIGDFPSPQAFHTLKVQCLGDDDIKAFTKFRSDLVVPVLALVGDVPIQPSKLSDTTPPVVRTSHFARKAFAESLKFFQGVFQKLRRLFLFTVAKCQVGFPYQNLSLRSHL